MCEPSSAVTATVLKSLVSEASSPMNESGEVIRVTCVVDGSRRKRWAEVF